MKLLFIGQAPGKPRFEGDVHPPFDPHHTLSGRRLAGFVGYDFMDRHEFTNLFDTWTGRGDSCNPHGDAFPLAEARERASTVKLSCHGRDVILVGQNVAEAFGESPFYFRWRRPAWVGPSGRVTAMPHPSGVNRWWNAPTNVAKAKRFFRKLRTA